MRIPIVILLVLSICVSIVYAGSLPGNTTKINSILAGDANGSGKLSIMDAAFLVRYLRGIGPAPKSLVAGDANGDCRIDLLDAIYLVNYFKGQGPAPVAGRCP